MFANLDSIGFLLCKKYNRCLSWVSLIIIGLFTLGASLMWSHFKSPSLSDNAQLYTKLTPLAMNFTSKYQIEEISNTEKSLPEQIMSDHTTVSLDSENIALIMYKVGFSMVLKPVYNGFQLSEADFQRGENNEVIFSCSIQWRNTYYVFGGKINQRQIYQLSSCSLLPVGELSFDFYWGDCATDGTEKIYLCFDFWTPKKCFYSSRPTEQFDSIVESNHSHRTGRIASNGSK